MIRKVMILLSLAIMLTATGNQFSIHKVHAEALNDIKNNNPLPHVNPSTIQTKQITTGNEIPNIQESHISINDQIKRVSDAIQENKQTILMVDKEITAAKSDVEQLENEIRIIKENIAKRNEVLKERALAYQHSDKHVAYLEVLLGATSLSDLVDRVGAVAAISEADQNLLEQQESQQQKMKDKQLSLENKLIELDSLKDKLETMQAHLTKQQEEYQTLQIQQEQEAKKIQEEQEAKKIQQEQEATQIQQEQEAKKMAMAKSYVNGSTKIEKDYIGTVINAGNKYIGNSVYVFGGGRNANDIALGRFDCSGFVHWAFAEAGINIGNHTSAIKNDGKQVSPQEMQPGDIVFFDTYKKDGHVGIYLGDGKFIGSQSSTGVAIADMTNGYWKNAFKGHVIRI